MRTPRLPDLEYAIDTTWTLRADPAELCAVFRDTASVTRWWRAAFLSAEVLEAGDALGVGRIVAFRSKGWLPYTVVNIARIEALDPARGFTMRTFGDIVGTCDCTIAPAGEGRVRATFRWRLRIEKPMVKLLTPWLRPLFVSNHRWLMRQGLVGLRHEIARRRRGEPDYRPNARPPRPAFPDLAWAAA
jgi:hypothetical protein